jgi:hypothetical protein
MDQEITETKDIDVGKLTDRELLVQIATSTTLNFREVRKDIKQLRDGTQKTIDDHEIRIRAMENDFLGKVEHEKIHTALEKFVDNLRLRITYAYAFAAGVVALASLLMWVYEIKR